MIQSWERSLRSAFGDPALQLTRRSSKPTGRFYVEISTPNVYRGIDASHPISELQRPDGRIPRDTFWFSFKANFDLFFVGRRSAREHVLEHASLSVFQRLPTRSVVPMFRAEWDSRAAEDSSSNHAQPHWHFTRPPDRYTHFSGGTAENTTRLADFTGIREGANDTSQFGELIDIGGFHFAMSQLWSPDVILCQKQVFTTTDEVGRWFNALTTYISDQLAYVMRKMVSVQRQNPTEFGTGIHN